MLSELIPSSNYILCLNAGYQLGKKKSVYCFPWKEEKEGGKTIGFYWTYSKVYDTGTKNLSQLLKVALTVTEIVR